MLRPHLTAEGAPSLSEAKGILEQLKQQIESFAPQEAEFQAGREQLYAALEEIGTPEDTDTYGPDVGIFILQCICAAQQAQEERTRAAKLLQQYRMEKKRVKKLLEQVEALLREIAGSPVVRWGPRVDEDSISESIRFYEPDEVQCPHGRLWKVCVEARGLLAHLSRAPQSKRWLLQRLKDIGIDPATPADHLCAFEPLIDMRSPDNAGSLPIPSMRATRTEQGPASHLAARPGRLTNTLQNFLLDNVIGCLMSVGWASNEGCYHFLAEIMSYCFGADVSASSLSRQWRRRHPTETRH